MRRPLRWVAGMLGLLALGIMAEVAPRAGGNEIVPRAGAPPAVCSDPAVGFPWASWVEEATGPEGSSDAAHPWRFDCGVGEAWGRHLP